VIICQNDPDFVQWANTLATWRNEQGISTGVYTIDEIGGNTTSAIETWVDNAYEHWSVPPAAILLLGDYGTGATGINSPMWDGYCRSDNIYADFNGNDLPDIIFARITARDAGELETMIGKMLDYETAPPVDPYYYQNPLLAGGWQTERWFILSEEVLAGYFENVLGKTPVREYAIYSGTPGSIWSSNANTSAVTSYFGPSGLGYLPATPAHLTDWGGNASGVNAAINTGTFLVQHRDHGDVDGWGEPGYTNSDLAGLHNEESTFVFSVNCLTGKFDNSSECFTEKFHRMGQGALGLIAATEISYSFVNDTYIWGMYDYFWPDFDPGHGQDGEHDLKPAFGNASGKYYLEASSWPYNPQHKVYTHHLFHHHGDAFMTVYSEVPENLSVVHDQALLSGLDFYTVAADEGALIGLSVNGELIGSAIGTGSPLQIPIVSQLPGNELVVTVTKQNHYRYRVELPIVPPNGPYVVYDSNVIIDTDGNNDGMLDYAEQVDLDMTLHNVGLELSTGVSAVLSTDDPLVTIINGAASFANIPADGLVTTTGAFTFAVDASVPDMHRIDFALDTTDADSNYTSYFQIIAHAPDVVVAGLEIVDGEDGVLDPGETADLTITFENLGSSATTAMDAALASLNPNMVVTGSPQVTGPLAGGTETAITYQVTADEAAEIGEVVPIQIDLTSPTYEFHTSKALTIGLTIEDFEGGNFIGVDWVMGGAMPWTMETNAPYEGVYCVRSGAIPDNSTTTLSTTMSVMADGEISFYQKVSSETDYDYLRFKIDGAEAGAWAGSNAWTRVAFPVTAGEHTFTWSYEKDTNTTGGSDCAWIDYVIFPAVAAQPRAAITINPGQIEAEVSIPDTTSHAISLVNTGEADLHYTVALTSDTRMDRQPPVQLAKGEADPRVGTPPTDGFGGPDAFGYSWIDSDEPAGPTYEWVEINELGTNAGGSDDTNLGPFDLGFEFTYYGESFNQVRLCTNGWMSFTSTATSYNNDPIPNGSEPNNLIAPFWDDLNPGAGGDIYYYADEANGRFIAEWDQVSHYGNTTDKVTFQVILTINGEILIQYKDMVDVNECTVGTENATGDDGLQVTFNAAYITNEKAVLFHADKPWATVMPVSGTVEPGLNAMVRVIFNSEDIEEGNYTGSLLIHANAPNSPETVIPVTLHVYGSTTGAEDGLPRRYALGHAHPNPFNPATTIGFAIPRAGHVKLSIYDIAGRLVKTLADENFAAGDHSILWRGTDNRGRRVSSGTYFYRLESGDFRATEKMLLVK